MRLKIIRNYGLSSNTPVLVVHGSIITDEMHFKQANAASPAPTAAFSAFSVDYEDTGTGSVAERDLNQRLQAVAQTVEQRESMSIEARVQAACHMCKLLNNV